MAPRTPPGGAVPQAAGLARGALAVLPAVLKLSEVLPSLWVRALLCVPACRLVSGMCWVWLFPHPPHPPYQCC